MNVEIFKLVVALGSILSICDSTAAALTQITGSISYQFNLTDPRKFDKTGFTDRLSDIFSDSNLNSTVSERHEGDTTIVNFIVVTASDQDLSNITKYQADIERALMNEITTLASFRNSTSIIILSAKADVNECESHLHSCGTRNQTCFNMDIGFGCACSTGFSDRNGSCVEIYCMLADAPTWPRSATRSVRLQDGSHASSFGRLPYKAYITYTCPYRYNLVDAVSGKAVVDVIECVGTAGATTVTNAGWTGGEVRCDMSVGFMVAIIMAAISSAIIVLVLGGFIVSCSNAKKKKNPPPDTLSFDMELDTSFS